MGTLAEHDVLIEERADYWRCENPITVCSNFKRFFMLSRLKTLRIIFTIMAQQAEIGRAQKFLGFRSE